jgi:peroxiredoxin family protein
MSTEPKFVIFAHNATYDKLHQVATLGMTAAAMGKDVIVVLLFWTIKKLAEGKIDQIDFPPEYAGSAEAGWEASVDRLQRRLGIYGGGGQRGRTERR